MNALRQKLRWLILAIIISFLLYTVTVIWVDAAQVWNTLAHLGMWTAIAILGLSLLNYLLRFARWQLYTQRLGYHIPLAHNIAYYLAGFALTVTPGKSGEALRSLYLKPYGMPYTQSLAAFFTERLLDIITITLLAALIMLAIPGYGGLIGFFMVLLILLTLLITHPVLPHRLHCWANQQPVNRWRHAARHLANLLAAAKKLLQIKPFYGGLALGMLAWGAEGWGFYLTLRALEFPIPLLTATGIYAVAVLAGALSFLPGGLGGTEAVMGGLLLAHGASPATAVAATLICRLATLWFAVFIGLLILTGVEFIQPRATALKLH